MPRRAAPSPAAEAGPNASCRKARRVRRWGGALQVRELDGRVKETHNAQEANAKAAAAVRVPAPERDARDSARLQKQIAELEAKLKNKDVQLQQVERQAGMTSALSGKGREAQGGALQLVIAALLMLSFMTTLMVDRSAVLQLVL